MTNPTADAIAALTLMIERLPQIQEHPQNFGWLKGQLHKTRSALLSAQGQAGKPVASDAMVEASARAIWANQSAEDDAADWDDLPESYQALIRSAAGKYLTPAFALYQPQPAAGATDEQIEAAAQAIARLDYEDEIGTANWAETPEDARAWYRSLALAALSSALATIKGLET